MHFSSILILHSLYWTNSIHLLVRKIIFIVGSFIRGEMEFGLGLRLFLSIIADLLLFVRSSILLSYILITIILISHIHYHPSCTIYFFSTYTHNYFLNLFQTFFHLFLRLSPPRNKIKLQIPMRIPTKQQWPNLNPSLNLPNITTTIKRRSNKSIIFFNKLNRCNSISMCLF